jgi:hypothetical protein
MIPRGVLVTQVTDFPRNLRRTIKNLAKVFPYVLPIDIGFDFSMFNFVMASSLPLRQRRPLPGGLRFINQDIIQKLFAHSLPLTNYFSYYGQARGLNALAA